MSEVRIVELLEEIRNLQEHQLRLSQENSRTYQENVNTNEKSVRRAKKIQIGYFVVIFLFLLFVIYAEWFLDGIPKPPWVK